MRKTYWILLDELRDEANRLYPTEQARDGAVLDKLLSTMYAVLEKLAEEDDK